MSGIPPWHLWGDAKQLEPVSGGLALSPTASTTQIVRVGYGRPDTWRFLFAAVISGGSGTGGAPVSPGDLTVRWDIITGVGRISVSLNGFEQYKFQWAGALPIGTTKFSADVIGPVRDDSAAALVDNNNRIDLISGQDIQVSATAVLNTRATGDTVQVQAFAFFTPNVHVRPEWHEGRYPGGETEGH